MYDSRIGRFLSVDPETMSMPWSTPYSYAGNSPIAYIDQDGRNPVLVIWLIVEAGLTLWDAWDVYKTVSDDQASAFEKTTSVAGALGGFFFPGGGYSKVDDGLKLADDAIEFTAERATREQSSAWWQFWKDTPYKNTAKNLKEIHKAGSLKKADFIKQNLHLGIKSANALHDARFGGILRDHLVKAGKKLKDKWEAHHIIPTELIEKNATVRKAIEEGFDFNGLANGIPLDKASKHSGSHPNYTDFIQDKITEYSNSGKYNSATDILNKAIKDGKDYIKSLPGKLD